VPPLPSGNNHDVVVIGGSAGGIDAVRQLLHPLPHDLPATLLVVLHTGDHSPRMLDRMFEQSTVLDCAYAEQDMTLERGRVLIAPPEHHMVIDGDRVRLVRGPTENRARPSIDVLFRSAAVSCRARTIGVVLSGNLNDGSAGLLAIKQCGGLTLVQDPAGIDHPDMPTSALAAAKVDGCAELSKLAAALIELVHEPLPDNIPAIPKIVEIEAQMALNPSLSIEKLEQIGQLSTMTCPECGGALLQLGAQTWRFRCRVGHAFTAETMVIEQKRALESALWLALRTLENDITLRRQLVEREHGSARMHSARAIAGRIDELEDKAAVLRKLLFG
jgi:two-component system, chemotaxis family, protein-glutamate methylesterase/glutaminase